MIVVFSVGVGVMCTYRVITIMGVETGREDLFVLVMVDTKSLVSEPLNQSGSNAE